MSSSRAAPAAASSSVDDDDNDAEESAAVEVDKSSSAARAALNGVTDYHEERELDSSAASKAFESLNSSQSALQTANQDRLNRLAAVKVVDAEISLVARELEISDEEAEQKLREFNNDIAAIFKEETKVQIKAK